MVTLFEEPSSIHHPHCFVVTAHGGDVVVLARQGTGVSLSQDSSLQHHALLHLLIFRLKSVNHMCAQFEIHWPQSMLMCWVSFGSLVQVVFEV